MYLFVGSNDPPLSACDRDVSHVTSRFHFFGEGKVQAVVTSEGFNVRCIRRLNKRFILRTSMRCTQEGDLCQIALSGVGEIVQVRIECARA